jgi:UDP-N-acetylglucosamine diphosphorylase / glucose-1-phosphate thymidylyltransferase / UDP-N-acetylgalactosamine diphosphorylase / glucosamine-1-phosphate N-acetyltransferase / galactosamine-1-phosphate N-acetyltransferase
MPAATKSQLILFDDPFLKDQLWPLTATRPIAKLRVGIDTLAEKWEHFLKLEASYLTENYLSKKYKTQYTNDNIYINAGYIANEELAQQINDLNLGEALLDADNLVALRTEMQLNYPLNFDLKKFNKKIISTNSIAIGQLSDLFIYNGKLLEADFQRITSTITSAKCSDPFTVLYNESKIYLGQNINLKSAVLDASFGPIFIDDHAIIEIGALIQGPVYIGKNSIVSLGAKIRPNTTIGPFCKVGGEVSKSIIFGYSNKSHDGFMGCSVIGEWCNWGAGTNNSNLKNDYKPVSCIIILPKN